MFERGSTKPHSPQPLGIWVLPPVIISTHSNSKVMANKTFKQFKSLSSFLKEHNASKKDLSIALTTNGFQLLTINGEVVSTIHGELKGRTPQQTAKTLASVNLTFGIPHDNGLPCLLEDKSTWEEVAIF